MAMINLEQGSKEWLEYRQGKIMATDVSIIMESNPFRTQMQLWEEKLGLREPQKVNEAMLRGQSLEKEARELACEMIGNIFEPCVFESDVYSWAAASLDGISTLKDQIVEIKCPKEKTHVEAINGIVPPYCLDQIQWQLFVTGSDICYYFSYRPEYDEEPFHIIEINPDPKKHEMLLSKSHEFYLKMCTMEPPIPWVFSAS